MTDSVLPLVLASTSPYRKALLSRLGIAFSTVSPDIDESRKPGESPDELVRRLSLDKARAGAKETGDALVIGSDQVAVIDDEILGKPGSADAAVQQLARLSGHAVTFLTGLSLVNTRSGNIQAEVVPFRVMFRTLDDRQIRRYIENEQPLNCAGSFKSEGMGITLFEKMEGEDPSALVGLPLIRLTTFLGNENVILP